MVAINVGFDSCFNEIKFNFVSYFRGLSLVYPFGNKISHISGISTSTAMIDMCEIHTCAREAKQNYLSTRYYFLSINALLKTAVYTSVVPLGKT